MYISYSVGAEETKQACAFKHVWTVPILCPRLFIVKYFFPFTLRKSTSSN